MSKNLKIILIHLIIVVANGSSFSQINADVNCNEQIVLEKINFSKQNLTTSNTDTARFILKEALFCSQQLKSIELEAAVLHDLGLLEFRTGGPQDAATQYFLESLALYTDLNDEDGIGKCNLQLGVLYFGIRNYKAAVKCFKNILNLELINEQRITLTYYLLALSYSELENFEEAEGMFEKAAAGIDPNDSVFHLQILAFKGRMCCNQGNHEKAIEILEKAKKDYQSVIQKSDYSPLYAFLANAYLHAKKYNEAIKYGRIAYIISSKSKAATIYLREAETVLHRAHYQLGNSDSAYFYLKALSHLNDSVNNKQVLQRVAELGREYEFDQFLRAEQAKQELKEELVQKELDRQKLIRNLTSIALIVSGLFAVIFFRQRLKTAKERDRSEKLLLNILPEEIARELKDEGRAAAKEYDEVSILFTDFKDFTQVSTLFSASELVNEINTCYEAFDGIAEKYRIEKIKTIGDSYMAAGGVPIPDRQAALRTVRAALEMQQFIIERYRRQMEKGKMAFQMRVGVHTGKAVAGVVGKKKFQYDIWGDSVNTASRIENAGEVGKVNISQATFDLIMHHQSFTFEKRGKIEARGKGQLEMYFVYLS